MSDVKIFWDPSGLELDSLGTKKYLRVTDGDTPYISMSIRMLSIDTPEVHYPGNLKPSRQDENLAELAGWMQAGKAPINDDLAAYLKPRLATGKAGTLQGEQGEAATKEFEKMLESRLTRPDGSKRQVYLHSADEPFDQYGRLLAYMSAYYSAKELATMTYKERSSFNLMMIESGWAAPFPIYPSIPKQRDLIIMQEAGKDAFESKRGAWAEPKTLIGYEFRMCVRLHQITKKLVNGQSLSSKDRYSWISRYCLDVTTREMFFPQDYYKVKPYNRIFVWPEDAVEAIANLNLTPPD